MLILFYSEETNKVFCTLVCFDICTIGSPATHQADQLQLRSVEG